MPFPRRILALLVCLAVGSCATYRETVAIHFSTDPPGADVIVNGVPSGYATPCMVALPKEHQVITFEKPGFQVPRRVLFSDPANVTWFYTEATVGPHTFDFPIFINLDDFLDVVHQRGELMPGRVFVRLKRLSDAPANATQ